jgi:hypothetical protein
MPATSAPTLDPRTRRYLAPTRVLWTSDAGVSGAERLLTPGGQAVVYHPTTCSLAHDGTAPGVLLDFGRELHGALQIITSAYQPKQPVRVRVRLGESASEAMGQSDFDHSLHDAECTVAWCGAVEIGQTGFRFARIDLVQPGARLDLVGVRAVSIERPDRRIGGFRCSDDRVNAVWETATRSVELCMQDLLWDGIKRDRLAWMGDTHPEAMVVAAVHGDHAVVRDTMDFLRDTTPLPGWMNGIGSYSLWWIITQRDWWRRTGNRTYLQAQAGYLRELTQRVAATIGADGVCGIESFLIDWETARDNDTTRAGRQALARIALLAAAELLRTLGDEAAATPAVDAAARIARAALPTAASKQAAALAVLADLRDAAEAEGAVLGRDPTAGLSPFYGYYVLEARARAGAIVGGLDLLRRYWGAMLDLGATSFWEHFDLNWLPAGRIDELPRPGVRDVHRDVGDHCYVGLRHSLCHGWSGGPSAWLIDQVLGIHPLEPGYAAVRIAPRLGDLAWAEGAVATPHGPIRVSHRQGSDGAVVTTCDLPRGVRRV